MKTQDEGIGNLPGYSKYLEDQKRVIEVFEKGFPSREKYLAWKIEFTHLIFGKNGIETFELLTQEILEPFFYGDKKDQENGEWLRYKIADTFRKDCFTESDSRFSQRAQEINIESKKHDYHSSVEPQ